MTIGYLSLTKLPQSCFRNHAQRFSEKSRCLVLSFASRYGRVILSRKRKWFHKVLLKVQLYSTGISSKPAILTEPLDVPVSQSSFTVLCIKSTGSVVEWYRRGESLDTTRDSDLHVTSDGSLHVKNAQRQRDEGSYYCVVSSGRQSVISRTVDVKFACKYLSFTFSTSII